MPTRRLDRQEISAKLNILHSKLPRQPTVVKEFYSVPHHLGEAVLQGKFSQESLQDISDHIGAYLGLLRSVKITVGIESSDYRLAGKADLERADQVGLYKVIGGSSREIQLTKRFRFELKHILAILAHESMHNYLYSHNAYDPNEGENEVLTDLAAVYLGLGHLLIEGYEPIVWKTHANSTNDFDWVDEFEASFFGGQYVTHHLVLGYVTQDTLIDALVLSTELRGWQPKAVLKMLPVLERPRAYMMLRSYMRRVNEEEKRRDRSARRVEENSCLLGRISKQIETTRAVYIETYKLMHEASKTTRQYVGSAEDSARLVRIANKMALGEVESEIDVLSSDIKSFNAATDFDVSKLGALERRAGKLLKEISDWRDLLRRHI